MSQMLTHAEARMAELKATARYHRERLALYRARTYGPRLTTGRRLRELELASRAADERLRRARRAASS